MKKWLDRYDKGGQAPARDNTTVYRNVLPISMPQLKPAYINPTPDYKDSEWYKQESEDFKTKRNITQPVLHAADVATDVMQFGNFIPLPQAQAVGKLGNFLGPIIDSYQAMDAFKNKNYVNASVNTLSALLPAIINNPNVLGGYRRSAKYNFGNRSFYNPIDRRYGRMTEKQLLANRMLLGTLGAETTYDSYAEGGETSDYNFAAWQLEDPIRASYHVINPEDFHGPDQYKYPNHMTFSDESMYSTPEHMGGHWTELDNGKWQFQPSQWNIQNAGGKKEFLKWWNEGEGKEGNVVKFGSGGEHGGLDRWFAEKWVDVKTGKQCGRQEGEKRKGYPACRPSKRVSSQTPKTASELSSSEKEKFKRNKTSSKRISYQHRRMEDGGQIHNWREVEVPHTKNQLSGWLDKL